MNKVDSFGQNEQKIEPKTIPIDTPISLLVDQGQGVIHWTTTSITSLLTWTILPCYATKVGMFTRSSL